MIRTHSQKRGFTLIELMTSLSIFAIIVTISLGSILGIFGANRKSRALRTIMNNLNLAMEDMSKEMRYGTRYHCGSGDVTLPQNCVNGGSVVSFLSSDDVQVSYRVTGSTLERQTGASGNWLPFLDPNIAIESDLFYVYGTASGDGLQPKVLIKIQGVTGEAGPNKGRTNFTLQTLVSQREIDS